jgi:putative spermidine/putrescine transport system substrate-binding protein
MDALIAAAKAEGRLNLIAVPAEWANFGAIVTGFRRTYGISVTTDNPNGSSKEEIKAVQSLGKSSKAPDVLDLEMADALANTSLFAPFKVSTWGDIPDAQKESSGLWFQDYGGYMSIGYDSTKVPAIASLQDLLAPAFKGKVALKGDPNLSTIALQSVMMASLANGGSPDDISLGVQFFHQLQRAGDIVSIHATAASVKSGATPVVFDWDYQSAAHVQDVSSWTVVIPSNAVIGDYFAQAINQNAPHPAAARLWEEYLYSAEGQNLLLKGFVRPVRMAAMSNAGTLDQSAAGALPTVVGPPVFLSPDQLAAAKKYLAGHWAAAMT